MVPETLETPRGEPVGRGSCSVAASLRYGGSILLDCLPRARAELAAWRRRALAIPCPERRRQALGSLDHKAFHSLGAATFGALARAGMRPTVVRFAVALQTLSDYLDNLADRSWPLTTWGRRRIHQAMLWAVDPAVRPASLPVADGGYLLSLVRVCQRSLAVMPGYSRVVAQNRRLARLYARMQTLKHAEPGARRRRLARWAERSMPPRSPLPWWEFSAACGSTLAIFALTAQATCPGPGGPALQDMERAYFPWICALHILLDYLIDGEEDVRARELNFVACYRNPGRAAARITRLFEQSRGLASQLAGGAFHRLVIGGLVALYLTDPKARPWTGLLDALADRDPYVRALRPLMAAWRSLWPPAPPQLEPFRQGGPSEGCGSRSDHAPRQEFRPDR